MAIVEYDDENEKNFVRALAYLDYMNEKDDEDNMGHGPEDEE